MTLDNCDTAMVGPVDANPVHDPVDGKEFEKQGRPANINPDKLSTTPRAENF